MLGKYVRVRVTDPMHSVDSDKNFTYELNYGTVESGLDARSPVKGAYVMGVTHRVRIFEGRVIAVIKRKKYGRNHFGGCPQEQALYCSSN